VKGPIEITEGVHGLGTEIVNWYLVEEGGRLTAVDAGLPGFANTLEDDLRQIGHSTADVDAVVLTHSDSDHTGVVPRLQEAGARVLIHSKDEPAARKPGPKKGDASVRNVLMNAWRRMPRTVFAHTMKHGLKPSKVEGAETFEDGDVLDVPGAPRVVHTPGHTGGHCAIVFDQKGVAFVGDAMITHRLVTETVSLMPHYLNEDNAACRESLDVIEALDADIVLVGHGDPWRDGAAKAAQEARRSVS
jgi:glyoxylase-like metal-dependent hydrolase (beta-lactamase superfamily II)